MDKPSHIEVVELYCEDCRNSQWAIEINDYNVEHCVYCGGVNVDSHYETMQDWLEDFYPSLSLVRQKFFSGQEEAWGIIKNVNTDDELEEIRLLLGL